jgi:hypothetical protein
MSGILFSPTPLLQLDLQAYAVILLLALGAYLKFSRTIDDVAHLPLPVRMLSFHLLVSLISDYDILQITLYRKK